ncbi:MAG: hypothetical protein AAF570_03120 [Bacteroidota bacterium]
MEPPEHQRLFSLDQSDLELAREQLQLAKSFYKTGELETAIGNATTAEYFYQRAGLRDSLPAIYLLYGAIYDALNFPERAEKWSITCLETAIQLSDTASVLGSLPLVIRYDQAGTSCFLVAPDCIALTRSFMRNAEEEAAFLLEVGKRKFNSDSLRAAMEYFAEARAHFEQLKDTFNLGKCRYWEGKIALASGEGERAMEVFRESEAIFQTHFDLYWYRTARAAIAETEVAAGNWEGAAALLNETLEKYGDSTEKPSLIVLLNARKRVYTALENYEQANMDAELASRLARGIRRQELIDYSESYEQSAQIGRELEKRKLKINRFVQLQSAHNIQSYTMIGGIIFLVLVLFLVYRLYRIRRQALDHQLQFQTERQDWLKEALHYNSNSHMRFALFVARKEAFLNRLSNMAKSENGSETASINDLILRIREDRNLDRDRLELQLEVMKADDSFFYKLDKRFPDLTENERRLAALIFLKMSSREIAELVGISLEGIEKNRQRLRQKLSLPKAITLNEFFHQL